MSTSQVKLVSTMKHLGDVTSRNLEYSHRPGVPVSYGEETITESNLLELRRSHSDVIHIRTFSRHRESKIGSDWEWHIVGGRRTLKMRVQAKRVRRITIDLDPTDDPTHGAQQLAFFNRFYDTSCYLPLAGFLTFDDEVEQYLFCYVLRAGNVAAKHGATSVLKRLLRRLRRAFPRARLRIRLDAGFSGPELYAFFEAQKLEYVVGMAKNAWLTSLAEPLMTEVRSDFDEWQQTSRRYGECAYQAGSWPHERRVIVKAEVTAHFGRTPKDNPRFVVTNLKTSPRHVYEAVYCARGDVENRLKELKLGLEIDRTRCTSFLANQLRVLMSAAAYVLMQELRLKARRTGCGHAQVSTLRLRLLKLGAWIESSVRRIVIHLPIGMPFADDWRRIARSVGAVVT